MNASTINQADTIKARSISALQSYVPEGSTIGVHVVSTTRSNMSCRVVVVASVINDVTGDVEPVNIGELITGAETGKYNTKADNWGTVKLDGYGTDRVFLTGYNLGLLLYGNGYAVTAKHI